MALVFSNPASGLTDLPEALCAHDQPATSRIFEAIAGNAALGVTKFEVFYSDYLDGQTVELPISPIDEYNYSRDECLYMWCLRYGFNSNTGQPSYKGADLEEVTWVDPDTGDVHILKAYYVQGGEQHNSNDGIMAVWTFAVRGGVPLEATMPSAILQSAYEHAAPGVGTAILTLGSAPTPGNTLIFIHAGFLRGGLAMITPPSGLTLLSSTSPYGGDIDYQQANIWSRVVQPGDPYNWTFGISVPSWDENFAVVEVQGQPALTVSTGAAGTAGGTSLISNSITPSGPATVLCMFEWENWSSPAATASGFVPVEYAAAYSYPGQPSGDSHAAVLLVASGNTLPAGAITATLSRATDRTPVYATVLIPQTGIESSTLLRLASVPSPYDRPAGVWTTDDPLTDTNLTPLLTGSKYAVVDIELFSAQYTNSQVVPLPKSYVDGYTYSPAELSYFTSWFYTGKTDQSGASGPGRIKRKRKSVNSSTGVVSSEIDYYNGSTTTPTNDGIVQVLVLAQRARTYTNSFAGEANAWNDIDDSNWLSGATLTTDNYHGLTQNVRFATERIEVWAAEYANGATVPLPTGRNDGYTYSFAECMFAYSGDDSGAFSGAALLNENCFVDPTTGVVSYTVKGNLDGGGTGPSTSPSLLVVTVAARGQEVSIDAPTPIDNIPSDQNVDGTSLANQALASMTNVTVNGT